MGFIYMITSPCGKSYIGQTVRSVDTRWKQHVYTSKRKGNCCPYIGSAIRKYGENAMQVITLLEINDVFLDDYEKKFIALYNTKIPNGYNIDDGGKGCTDIVRKKISQNRTGIKHTEETRQKISKAQTGVKRNDSYIEFIKQRNHQCKEDSNLPMYICKVIRNGVHVGYQVSRHPTKGSKAFLSKRFTLEQKLEMAKLFIEYP